MRPAHRRGPERGDTVSASCKACSERFTYTVGESDHHTRCPDCHRKFEQLDRVSGGMRIRDDELRAEITDRIEGGQYGVWIDERTGDIYVYERDSDE